MSVPNQLNDPVFGRLSFTWNEKGKSGYWHKNESCWFYGLIACQVEVDVESVDGTIDENQTTSYTFYKKRWNKSYLFDAVLQYNGFNCLFKFCREHSKKIDLQIGVDWYTANSYDTTTPEVITGDNHLGGETIHHGPRNTFEANVYSFFDIYIASNVVFRRDGKWSFMFTPRNIKDPNWFSKLKYNVQHVPVECIILEHDLKKNDFKSKFI